MSFPELPFPLKEFLARQPTVLPVSSLSSLLYPRLQPECSPFCQYPAPNLVMLAPASEVGSQGEPPSQLLLITEKLAQVSHPPSRSPLPCPAQVFRYCAPQRKGGSTTVNKFGKPSYTKFNRFLLSGRLHRAASMIA